MQKLGAGGAREKMKFRRRRCREMAKKTAPKAPENFEKKRYQTLIVTQIQKVSDPKYTDMQTHSLQLHNRAISNLLDSVIQSCPDTPTQ